MPRLYMFKFTYIIQKGEINNRRRKGFTLLELILAAVMLAVALSVVLIEFLSCSLLSEASRNLTRATMHAQYVMEDIKNNTFADIKAKIDSGYWDWDSNAISSHGLSPLRDESIDTDESGTDLLDITVKVSWDDRSGRKHTPGVSLETLIAQP